MISIPGIIASSIQTGFARTTIEASVDYSTFSYSLCSFSAPENELPFWAFRFIDIQDTATTSYSLCSFSVSEGELINAGVQYFFLSGEDAITNSYSLCSFSVSEGELINAGIQYFFLSGEDAITNSYSLCSNSMPEGELANLNWGYFFLSGQDVATNSFTISSFNTLISELTLIDPLSTTTNINAFKTSIYGVSSDAISKLGMQSYERFSFDYWEVSTGGSWSIVPVYQQTNGYAFLSGGESWYNASVTALSARLVFGYKGRSYRTNPVALKPYSSVLDIPNLQLWLDASDSTTLSAGTGVSKNSFIDSSLNTFTITRNGNPGQGTFSPFYPNGAVYNPTTHGGSCYFDGTNGNYLSIPSNSAFNFASGTFTIECWVMFTALPTQTMIVTNYNSSTAGWYLQQYQSKFIAGFRGDGTSIQGTTTIQTNVWYHVAVSGSAGSYKLFVNGAQEGATYTGATSLAGGTLGIGAFGAVVAGQYVHNGYISNLRIVNGTALYTGSSLTVPTAPLTTITNTSLLLNFTNGLALDGAAENNLILNGNATVVNSIKKYGLGSYYFDGSGDFIIAPAKEDYNFGLGDFTIECWVRFINTTTGSDGIIDTGSSLTTGNGNQWFIYRNGNILRFGRHAVADLLTYNTSSLSPYTWYHIAVTRNNTELNMFINGVRVASTVYSGWVINGSNVRIGAVATPYYMNGWIDDVRLTKGIARYGPMTALLLNGNDLSVIQPPSESYIGIDYSKDKVAVGVSNNPLSNFVGPVSGAGSIYMAGGRGPAWGRSVDFLTLPNSVTSFGTQDFTVECWVNFSSFVDFNQIIGTLWTTGSQNASLQQSLQWSLIRNNTNGKFVWRYYPSTILTSTTTVQLNTWYHIAVVRSGSTIKMFVNGAEEASAAHTSSYSYTYDSIMIGRHWDQVSPATDWGANISISDLRITKGIARYPMVPSFPTAALPIDSLGDPNYNNVSALVRVNGNPPAKNSFVDESPNNFSITKIGDVAQGSVSPFPKIGATHNPHTDGASAYFGGSGYLTSSSTNISNFGTNPFTFECWVYKQGTGFEGAIYDGRPTSGNGSYFAITTFSNNSIGIIVSGSVIFTSTATFLSNQWNHIAVCRTSTGTNGCTVYLNGSSIGSFTSSTDFINGFNVIGAISFMPLGNAPWRGYISNLRIVKGTALYASNFTVPTAPLTNSGSNTSLLLRFKTADVVDETRNVNLIPVGDVKTSTAVTKYGSGSIYFDGNGDYLQPATNSDNFLFGTGDFTIEAWIYPNSLADYTGVVGQIITTANTQWTLNIWTDGRTRFQSWFNVQLESPANTIKTGMWQHVVAVRSGKNSALFVDGTRVAFNANDIFNWSSNSAALIGYPGNLNYFNGYIDDVRITKGVAVYNPTQTNFTPPTSQLTITNTTALSVAPFTPPSEHPNSSSGDPNFMNVALLAQGNQPSDEVIWRDKSPMGNFATQTNANNAPALSANSIGTRSALVFDGDDFLNLATPIPLSATNASSFFVYRRQTNGLISASIGNKNSAGYNSPLLHWNNNLIYAFEGYTDAKPLTGSIVSAATKRTAVYVPDEIRCSLLTLQNSNAVDNSGTGNSMLFQGTPNPTSTAVTISGVNTTAWTFNGSNSVYTSPSINFAYGGNPFTFEAWVFPTGIHGTNFSVIYSQAWSGNNYFLIGIQPAPTALPNHYSVGVWLGNGNVISPNTIFTAIPLSAWSHVALVREGTNTDELKLYINGNVRARATSNHDFSDVTNGFPTIGKYYHDSYGWVGRISNVRIIKGRALYTQNFIPTVQLNTITTARAMVRQRYYPTSWGTPPQNELLDGVGVYGSNRHSGPFGEFIYADCLLPTPEIELVGDSLRTKWSIT